MAIRRVVHWSKLHHHNARYFHHFKMNRNRDTLADENKTRGSQLSLKKRVAIAVCISLCSVAMFVFLATPELPYKTLETRRVVNISDRLSPLADGGSGFRLTTYPQLLEDGEELVVSWKGEEAAELTSQDYVTLSCGPTTGDEDFLMKRRPSESNETDHSVRFSGLYMLRCNYTAIYYTYDEQRDSFRALAKVEVGMAEPFETPKHGHLSLTNDETAMAILFNSGSSDTPMVKYGEEVQDLVFDATGTSTTYSADDM